jgi:guanylate kinase
LSRNGARTGSRRSSKRVPPRPHGVMLVLSGPSGVGKSTLCRRLLRSVPGLVFSVSYTTRPPRAGEKEGREYHFVPTATFRRLLEKGRLLEWARVDGELYGTSRQQVERSLRDGADVLLDVDSQGADQLRRASGQAVLIFLMPPGPAALRARHRRRGTEAAVRRRRLALARREVRSAGRYDYLVFNDRLDGALEELKGIVLAERCRTQRQIPRARRILRAFRNGTGASPKGA